MIKIKNTAKSLLSSSAAKHKALVVSKNHPKGPRQK